MTKIYIYIIAEILFERLMSSLDFFFINKKISIMIMIIAITNDIINLVTREIVIWGFSQKVLYVASTRPF
jgi:hypothetical protein